MVLSPTDLAPFVEKIAAVIRAQTLRTLEAIRAAGIQDRRVGEDAIWQLVQGGKVRIAPDSTLRWVKPHAKSSVVVVSGKKAPRARPRRKSAATR